MDTLATIYEHYERLLTILYDIKADPGILLDDSSHQSFLRNQIRLAIFEDELAFIEKTSMNLGPEHLDLIDAITLPISKLKVVVDDQTRDSAVEPNMASEELGAKHRRLEARVALIADLIQELGDALKGDVPNKENN